MKNIADLLGRICIALIFIYEVYDTIAYYKQTKMTMTSYNITWNQDILLFGILFFFNSREYFGFIGLLFEYWGIFPTLVLATFHLYRIFILERSGRN